ncbi:MAG TPA: T9SS type A sorting domain-containing protein [Saprospiraceae bacterium]|nr:T9SS type A sorting domain-containing protein [Saprospiraceae bacterium]
MKQNAIQFSGFLLLLFFILNTNQNIINAQPQNDICSKAISIDIASNAASCIWADGSTLNTIDGATQTSPQSPCSVASFRDDVWYKFSIPAGTSNNIVTVKVIIGSLFTDMPSVGLAVYKSQNCSASNAPIKCYNFQQAEESKYSFSISCGQDYLVRVWSSTGTNTDWKNGQGTFKICAYFEDSPDKKPVLWGANGEGAFNGGLNGWTTGGNTCGDGTTQSQSLWEWRANADSHGPLSAGQIINSPSACNGAMLFDSDFWDYGGNGLCITSQEAWLESPTIDLSSFNAANGVSVQFHQRVIQFFSQFFVDYSIDNGLNWINIEINQDIIPFTTSTPPGVNPIVDQTKRVYLPKAAGSSQLKIRFRAIANYYFWLIDDVELFERESTNLSIDNYYAIAPYKLWQKDQLESFGGLASITNKGGKIATHPNLSLDIKDELGALIWNDQIVLNNIASDSSIQKAVLPGIFNFTNYLPATYTAQYTLNSDSLDFDLTDNIQTFKWTVSDSIMAKEDLQQLSNSISSSTAVNFSVGNIYHIVNNKSANSKALYCNYVDLGVANPNGLNGATIFITLYKWKNLNGDKVVTPNELTTVGFNKLNFDGNDPLNTLFTKPLFDFTTKKPGVALESNSDYILLAKYVAPTSNPNIPCFISSDNLNYGATDLSATLLSGSSKFSSVFDNNNSGILLPLGDGFAPVIRMHITEKSTVNTIEYYLDQANKIFLQSNPVKDKLNLRIDLVNMAKTATIEIFDTEGKFIMKRDLNNIKNQLESFEVSSLINGNYILNFSCEAGQRSIKFMKLD